MELTLLTERIGKRDASLRTILRERTHDTHQMLHRHSSFVALFRQSITIDEYRQLIGRLHGFYAPLDDAVEALSSSSGHVVGAYDYTRRSDFLAQDMRDLGFSGDAIQDNPRCAQASEMVSARMLAGVLYVVEGATLGGSTIDRAAAKILSDDNINGRRYWSWCRTENKRCWSNMNAYLDYLPADDVAVNGAITGAKETFDVFANWLAPLDIPQRETA